MKTKKLSKQTKLTLHEKQYFCKNLNVNKELSRWKFLRAALSIDGTIIGNK